MISEKFLQYLWTKQPWPKHLHTTCGQPVTILHPGILNHGAGPDFAAASCRINGLRWHGAVEIHRKTAGWRTHGHHKDKKYDRVVLHVVWEGNQPIHNSQGGAIPTLVLKDYLSAHILKDHHQQFIQQLRIACEKVFHQVPHDVHMEALDAALLKRLAQKKVRITQLLAANKEDTEATVYQLLAYHLGFKVNSEAMLTLAKRLPIARLRTHQPNLLEIEALLFGQAGLLDNKANHPYLHALQKAYQRLAKKYTLTPMPATMWQWGGIRPVNTPTLRIAQLATLLHQCPTLFSWLANTPVTSLRKQLRVTPSPYWQAHYAFGKPSRKPLGGLGRAAANGLILNVVPALLWAYGQHRNRPFYKTRAFQVLRALPPEVNTVTRMWKSIGLDLHNAFDTQAAIGLFTQSCVAQQCTQCPIGRRVKLDPRVRKAA